MAIQGLRLHICRLFGQMRLHVKERTTECVSEKTQMEGVCNERKWYGSEPQGVRGHMPEGVSDCVYTVCVSGLCN